MNLIAPTYLGLFFIFVRMRVLKLFNYLSMGTALRKKPKDAKQVGARSGTHSKFIRSAMVGVFFFALMGFASFGFHTGQIHLIEMQFANAPVFSPPRSFSLQGVELLS